jgi:hypothetical protein
MGSALLRDPGRGHVIRETLREKLPQLVPHR